ncbi:MAG: hypothetical protein J3K34DRAFT_34665 [Monoraphidium minutum]|nr:MAG: hypothetical protein J3K34DRAFT_34665 [Monoraphidium minutum]
MINLQKGFANVCHRVKGHAPTACARLVGAAGSSRQAKCNPTSRGEAGGDRCMQCAAQLRAAAAGARARVCVWGQVGGGGICMHAQRGACVSKIAGGISYQGPWYVHIDGILYRGLAVCIPSNIPAVFYTGLFGIDTTVVYIPRIYQRIPVVLHTLRRRARATRQRRGGGPPDGPPDGSRSGHCIAISRPSWTGKEGQQPRGSGQGGGSRQPPFPSSFAAPPSLLALRTCPQRVSPTRISY